MTATAFDDRVDDGAALSGVGVTEEQPVLLPRAVGRIAFSTRLVSISIPGSLR